mgnify:CR=1 FL=1
MELKFAGHHPYQEKEARSNRTFMELKWSTHKNFMRRFSCSNRTFMELKFGGRSLMPGG